MITGDLIKSRQVEDHGIWQEGLKFLFASMAPGPRFWDIYRGDSFQIELANAADSFTLVMRIKAMLRSQKELDTRVAIGIGDKSFAAGSISQSNGSAFIHSGELLESLKAQKQSLAIRSPWREWDDEMNTYLKMALVIMDQWKPKTAELVSVVLQHPQKSQQEIADLLQIQQAGVSQGLKRAHLKELLDWDDIFRKKLKNFD